MEDRQERQDGFLAEVQKTLTDVQRSQVEARRESHEQMSRLEAMLAEVLSAVRPATGDTNLTPVPR